MAINALVNIRVPGLALAADDTLSTGICSLKRNAIQRIIAIPHSVTRNQFGHPDSSFPGPTVNPSHVRGNDLLGWPLLPLDRTLLKRSTRTNATAPNDELSITPHSKLNHTLSNSLLGGPLSPHTKKYPPSDIGTASTAHVELNKPNGAQWSMEERKGIS